MLFRKLKITDVGTMMKWGTHKDYRLDHYDFPYREPADLVNWYFSKQKILMRKIYGLFDEEGNVIGYVTLKNMHFIKGTGELGIAVDPNRCSQGYGEELLNKFSEYVFDKFPIHTLVLRVAKFNHRALRAYEKAGFVYVKESIERYEEQSNKYVLLKLYPDVFRECNGYIYTDFIIMKKEKIKQK